MIITTSFSFGIMGSLTAFTQSLGRLNLLNFVGEGSNSDP